MRAVAALVLLLSACGAPAPPPARHVEQAPSWADVFEGTPDIFVVIRPQALRGDPIYGALWRSLLRGAQARGFARGATMVEALEGASELIVGLNQGDGTIVLRGVPARLDPQRIVDDNGSPLFRPVADDRLRVVEYELVDRKNADAGGLFILPDRTWVGVLGGGRGRARQVFATPLGRPAPTADPAALVAARFGGPLVRMFGRHSLVGPLTRRLTTVTFSLLPGKGGVVVALAYADADAAAHGETEAKAIAADLAKKEGNGWIASAKITYEGTTVTVRVAVPPRLLEELPSVKASDLEL